MTGSFRHADHPREEKEATERMYAYPGEMPMLGRLARAFLPPDRRAVDDLDALYEAIEKLTACLEYVLGTDAPTTHTAWYAIYCEPECIIQTWRETLDLPTDTLIELIDAALLELPEY